MLSSIDGLIRWHCANFFFFFNYILFIIYYFCLEFQEAFQLFDSRGDGKIHVSQIGDALRALGQNPTESDVKKFTHQHKPDERISFEVFLPIYQAISKSRTSDTADDFIEGLRHFDKDGNGIISSAELRHLLTTLGTLISFFLSIATRFCFTNISYLLVWQVKNWAMKKSKLCLLGMKIPKEILITKNSFVKLCAAN